MTLQSESDPNPSEFLNFHNLPLMPPYAQKVRSSYDCEENTQILVQLILSREISVQVANGNGLCCWKKTCKALSLVEIDPGAGGSTEEAEDAAPASVAAPPEPVVANVPIQTETAVVATGLDLDSAVPRAAFTPGQWVHFFIVDSSFSEILKLYRIQLENIKWNEKCIASCHNQV